MKRIAPAIDLLLPRTCIVCGNRLLSSERHICLECAAEMPLTYFWKQSHNPMSDRFNEVIQKKIEDSSVQESYAYAAALFTYQPEAPFRLIPHNIKYKGDILAGEHFGRMLGKRLKDNVFWKDADLVIPVPLHWTRKFRRGYNQAEVIASGVATAMGVPFRTDLLTRIKRTGTQTKLNIEEKALNVADAFESRKCGTLKYRHIIIVDDVFTTGSTLGECFRALRSVFPPSVRISIATLAFVGRA